MHKPQAFLHARKAKPSTLDRGFCIKTHTEIADGKLNLSRASPQAHFEALDHTMLRSLLSGIYRLFAGAEGNYLLGSPSETRVSEAPMKS